MSDFLLYGATGYVGRATAALAVGRGLRPTLAARSDAVLPLAESLELDAVVVPVDDEGGLRAALADVPAVLSCAGPFHHTFTPVAEACLATGTHYLDITGEPAVFGQAAAMDGVAREAGVMLLPGAGFDVVPTDCLAAHLVRRLPTATHLRLAFASRGPASMPPGTIRTMLEHAPTGSSRMRRVDGRITVADPRPSREIDFGPFTATSVLHTWGDVFLAAKSTGIPNIEDHLTLPPGMVRQIDLLERFGGLLRWRPLRALLHRGIPSGATPEERAATATHVWGEVSDADGNRSVSRLHGPEAGLEWTARAALGAARRVLEGDAPPGHQTPSTAYGPDLVFDVEGVTREDVE